MRSTVYETYRSVERQHDLWLAGATKLIHVGVHHFGLAADIVFLDHRGNPTWDGDYSILGRAAKAHGLIWGGDWGEPERHHSFIDADHCQLVSLHDQAGLFDGTWYPLA